MNYTVITEDINTREVTETKCETLAKALNLACALERVDPDLIVEIVDNKGESVEF